MKQKRLNSMLKGYQVLGQVSQFTCMDNLENTFEKLHADSIFKIKIIFTKNQMQQRTEAKWFVYMVVFLVVYCGFLFVFRSALVNVEARTQLSLFKPEPAQIAVMALLILLYHFSFVGLYSFSLGGRWQRMATIIVCLLITGTLLYGFNEWFKATSHPFFQFANTNGLPWYAKEKPKFLIANLPLVGFMVIVFVFRIFMIFKPAQQ